MTGLRNLYFGSVVLFTLCLALLCAVIAASLFSQQAALARVLRLNIDNRRMAVELCECLADLIALERDRVESVRVLHDRVAVLLKAVQRGSERPRERELAEALDTAFAQYLSHWKALTPTEHSQHEAARQAATRFLEQQVFPLARELEIHGSRQIESSAEHHELVLRRLAWGMASVGGLGAVAGMVLGYGVARTLGRSIRRIQVQIRDAAGKLGPDLPEIVMKEEGDFRNLHMEVDRLSDRVEGILKALQQSEREVLRAEQLAAVGQLAAGVAHEIRNPLTSIKLLIQSGLEEPGTGLSSDDLRVIEAEVRRMELSLRTFLDFARPPHLVRRSVALGPLIRGVVDLIRGRADRQHVTIGVRIPDQKLTLVADPDRLRQVFVNLSLNALDAMPKGGTLNVRIGPVGTRGVKIEFADSGPGIPESVLPRLFEPFVSSKETGLGLGLILSKRIIEDHDGWIEGTNSPHGGARFVVHLPRVSTSGNKGF